MQKKAENFFQIAKINMQKKHKIIFQKSKNAKKKMQKKACGVYVFRSGAYRVPVFCNF